MAQQKGNALDDLMMSYADLNASKVGSTFKGPALKDVRVEKPSGPSYQSSQKARDWSTLAQNLEDAFVTQPTQSSLPPQPLFATGPQPPQPEHDDWGDFQDFSQNEPQSSQSLPPTLQPTSQPYNFTQQGPIFGQQQLSGPIPDKDTTSFNIPSQVNEEEDDDFADFVAARPAAKKVDLIPHSEPVVGSRLATFQVESPLHHFKQSEIKPNKSGDLDFASSQPQPFPTITLEPKSDDKYSALRDAFSDFNSEPTNQKLEEVQQESKPQEQEDDFGDFVEVNDTKVEENFKSVDIFMQNLSLSDNPLHSSSATPIATSERPTLDLLGSPEKGSSVTTELPVSATPQSPVLDPFGSPEKEKTMLPNLPVVGSDEAPVLDPYAPLGGGNSLCQKTPVLEDQSPGGGNSVLPNTDVIAPVLLDPFGSPEKETAGNVMAPLAVADFNLPMTASNGTVTETTQQDVQPDAFFAAQNPANNVVIPWHESEPPPPPPDLNDSDDFAGFSNDEILTSIDPIDASNHDILNDEQFFVEPKPSKPDPPMNTRKVSPELPKISPECLAPKVSPDSLSLKSLEDSSGNFNLNVKEDCPVYDQWLKALEQVNGLIEQAVALLQNINEDIWSQVFETEKSHNYILNIVAIYTVFLRISQSNPGNHVQVNSMSYQINENWSKLKAILSKYDSIELDVSLLPNEESLTRCGLCLCSIQDQKIEYAGQEYHAGCANFWVNRVEMILPKLELPIQFAAN